MKILCLGSVSGNYRLAHQKLAILSKKQTFDCVFSVGPLFSLETSSEEVVAVLKGALQPPFPVYFSQERSTLPEALSDQSDTAAGQLCSNLHYLGNSGRIKLAEGIKIGFVSTNDPHDYDLDNSTADAIVDILLTYRKPSSDPETMDFLANFTGLSQPKYHFYPSLVYLEEIPYCSGLPDQQKRLTREIGLAPTGNAEKMKWLYAFNLTQEEPDAKMLNTAIANPYLRRKTKEQISGSSKDEAVAATEIETTTKDEIQNYDQRKLKRPPNGYSCKLCSIQDDHYFKDCRNKVQNKKRKRGDQVASRKHVDPGTCFFCLSNPNLAHHLIVSIGDCGSYMVLPKGGMTQNHVIVLPVDHKATLKDLGDTRELVQQEMTRYVMALEQFYERNNMVGITFEISRTSGVHFHMQIMPIPEAKVSELIDAFFAFAENERITLEKDEPDSTAQDYFNVRFPKQGISLTGQIRPDSRFDLQFGRRVISDVMGVPERAHWKDCLRTEDQEKADADIFKAAFKEFDFTM